MHKSLTLKNVLYILLAINVSAFLYYIFYVLHFGYLPSPFIFDKSNTLMDLFNPMAHAIHDDAYTVYQSVYPPLNFIFLKIFHSLFNGSETNNATLLRDTSRGMVFGWVFLYLLIPYLVIRTDNWRIFKRDEKLLIYLVVVLSFPMLFTLERGNLILLSLIPLACVFSTQIWVRLISIAVLVNLKPYFILLFLSYLTQRKWKEMGYATLVAGIIFLVSGLIYDSSHFILMMRNLINFGGATNPLSIIEVVNFSSSISMFSFVASKKLIPISLLEQHPNVLYIILRLPEILKWTSIAFALSILYKKYRSIDMPETMVLLLVMISNIGVSVGGYTFITYIVAIPTLMHMQFKRIYISFLIFISLPFLCINLFEQEKMKAFFFSYFSNEFVYPAFMIDITALLRPILNIMFLWMLSYEFLLRKKQLKN
jgi:hypothetical protein